MLKRLQGVVAGILIGVLIMGGAAYAATQKLDATFNNIKIVIDGTEIQPRDVNGNAVEPFIVNGTTYLPVRAVAAALGKEVYWDGPNYTVYLGEMGGALDYPSLKLEDTTNIGDRLRKAATYTDNYGNTYSSANTFGYGDTYETLLNMKYSRFKGTIYVGQGESSETKEDKGEKIVIEVDGKVVYSSPAIHKTTAPINIDIDIRGANDFKIIHQYAGYGFSLNIGDAGFYQ